VCLPGAYDDGFSGATMDRPALQRLLADITAGRVEIVVVYKIDRLTRWRADFDKSARYKQNQRLTMSNLSKWHFGISNTYMGECLTFRAEV
jgi:DNA invertase Pin-like site-specific DNA recombinase